MNMKTKRKSLPLLAALALGALLMAGASLPARAGAAMTQMEQSPAPYGGKAAPAMWWPASSGGEAKAPREITPERQLSGSCWGGWR